MASTNQTPHLGLNQWVLSDPFLMEDMNADNAKIDAAVAANPYVKLMDVTTTAAAQQIDLDLSGIELRDYAELQVIATLRCVETNGSVNYYFKVNNSGASTRDQLSSSVTQTDYYAYIRGSMSLYYPSVMRIKLFGFPATGEGQYYLLCSDAFCAAQYSGYLMNTILGAKAMSAPVSTLNFLSSVSGELIAAGSKIEVYGVKR